MPVGTLKNTLYGAALPVFGKRCEWKAHTELEKILHSHHAVGASVQRFEKGRLTDCHCVGYAKLKDERLPVTPDTVFRTASIAKMVTALLVFRLQTQGKLHVQQDIQDFLGYEARNPHHPHAPITLAMLLSHTSGMVDSQTYFASFQKPVSLQSLLHDPQTYTASAPGLQFRYSNFAAGMIGCLLEKTFGMSLETLAQKELFEPLGVQATYDLTQAQNVADSYRVLPSGLAFDAQSRRQKAQPLDEADGEHHYLLASGSLYLTARDLAKLTLAAWNGADGFISEESLRQMHTPLLGWPEPQVNMKHGMGLLQLEDQAISARTLWGHQGFAYGAVNGVFFDAEGNGFASLNSGVSERRIGHLALINRDLIRLWMKK